MKIKNDNVILKNDLSEMVRFTDDFKDIKLRYWTVSYPDKSFDIEINEGMVIHNSGKGTLIISGDMFESGKDLIIHFKTEK
ncbi:hypothetical protein AB0Y20_18700 [Heyndrickxia oleronia]|uniref:hypothetical protein n=1 Tax=Heyndrickxia oleronia TaxID=38875 RepID=UPI003F230497